MACVKILVNGYAKKRKGYELATPNTVLVFDGTVKVLIDPGSNRKLLIKALKKEHIRLKDIDIIFLTHYHLDHILNIRLFSEHEIYDGDTISRFDKIIGYSGSKIPRTNIKIIKTPGHAYEHCSLLVDTASGKVCVSGDVFWFQDGKPQKTDKKSLINKKDPYVKNKKDLISSRKKLLSVADYIIPGHGKMFKVEK